MFQFSRFPPHDYGFIIRFMIIHHVGFPIRKSAGQSLFPANRGLSQVVTSFIGSRCQGIHLMLFFAWTAPLVRFSLSRFCFFAWASQIIVLGCGSQRKDFLPDFHDFKPPEHLCSVAHCSFPLCYGKTFNLLKIFLNTTICFVSYTLFGFQWTFCRLRCRSNW